MFKTNSLKSSWNLGIGEDKLLRFSISWGNGAGERARMTGKEYTSS